jgi:hypothetical protein
MRIQHKAIGVIAAVILALSGIGFASDLVGDFSESSIPVLNEELNSLSSSIKQTSTADRAYIDSRGAIDRGDPAADDKILANFTKNGAWQDWNLSAIVPSGARFVMISAYCRASTTGHTLKFRKNGNSNIYAVSVLGTVSANLYDFKDILVPLDTNRFIEYQATNTTDWTDMGATVKGWIY